MEEEAASYIEAALPQEMADMPEDEKIDKVCTVKRKGDRLCIIACEGHELAEAEEAEEGDDMEEAQSPEADAEKFFGGKGMGGKKPSDYMKSKMPAYSGGM